MPTPIDREKLLSLNFINGPLPSKPRVKEWRDETSGRMKAVTDELGHTVTQHGKIDRQDVQINAETVTLEARPKEM